jgi:hypothetical protein
LCCSDPVQPLAVARVWCALCLTCGSHAAGSKVTVINRPAGRAMLKTNPSS